MGQHYRECSHTVSQKSECLDNSMNCLYTNAHCVGKKQEALEFPMQFEDYYLIQIVGMVGCFTQLDCCKG